MIMLRRWVPLLALIVLLGFLLSVIVAPVFAVLLAIAVAVLIEQWRTGHPGRLLSALTRGSRRRP